MAQMSTTQPHLPHLLHGRTNMESGVISCREWGWSIPRIGRAFRLKPKDVKAILVKYGYLHPPRRSKHEQDNKAGAREGDIREMKRRRYPKRGPDIETPAFKLWQVMEEEKAEFRNVKALITIDYGNGERMLESRLYPSTIIDGYELLIISKVNKQGMIYMAVKLKRPDKSTALTAKASKCWLSQEEYAQKIRQVESNFAGLFDTSNPTIVPGKHYDLYITKGRKHGLRS